jgi:hypothetical protein
MLVPTLKKLKSVAVIFPKILKQAKQLEKEDNTSYDLECLNSKRIHFIPRFKYIGYSSTNEDADIIAKIKPWLLISIVKHLLNCKDIDIHVKHQICIAGPLNALLWGANAETPQKAKKLPQQCPKKNSQCYLESSCCDNITNKKVCYLFCNIPGVDTLITRRTACYIKKICRSAKNSYPRLLLNAGNNKTRKTGAQLCCNNSFATLQPII